MIYFLIYCFVSLREMIACVVISVDFNYLAT